MAEETPEELEKAKLNTETGVIAWEELARHFARGVVIRIDSQLDLVEVGQALLRDDAESVDGWQKAGVFRRASDDDARRWNAEKTEFWALVITPWVVVQEIDKESDGSTLH